MSDSINIVHLYADEMNIYGDNGNVQTLVKRLQWRNIPVKVKLVGVGDKIPGNTDIIVSGGGQDKGQFNVEKDLQSKAKQLRSMSDAGVTMLTICGTYQLFGRHFITNEKSMLRGISIFDAHTIAQEKRLIGNILLDTKWGELVGFENHSGQTQLGAGQLGLGTVIKGNGNNDITKDEGAIKNNVFGTYLHGPILPKNPKFADELLRRTLELKFGSSHLEEIDDVLERQAFAVAKLRP